MVVFQIVVVVVCVVSAVIATVTFVRASRLYDRIGRLGTYSMSIDETPSTSTREQVRDEVDEMLQAIAEARKSRGEPPPDLFELIQELRANAASRSVAERD
jgi:flagellar basal body-associated protein FliL